MQDRKALQAGTSHFLGQNFAKAMDISFQDENGEQQLAWTTSWGVSTRLVGGLIMTHSDDDGLVLPPRLAPAQIVILPIHRNEEERTAVLAYCEQLAEELRAIPYHESRLQIQIDKRDLRGGEKSWQAIKKGIPIRLEVGPRDMQQDAVFMGRRDKGPKEKESFSREAFKSKAVSILDDMQQGLYARALARQQEHSQTFDKLDDLIAYFSPENPEKPEIHGGFAYIYCKEDDALEARLKAHKLTHRCTPLEAEKQPGPCVFTGETCEQRVIVAKAY